ncbi:MAG: hypothetical protein LDL33_14200 [Desulfomonile sp.]|nr:hypothetical protein [Desulfomonile sp.]
MNESAPKARPRIPKQTRTNRDWVMLVLGVMLIVFFVFAGYVTLTAREDGARPRKRGPVKDPKISGIMENPQIIGSQPQCLRTAASSVG